MESVGETFAVALAALGEGGEPEDGESSLIHRDVARDEAHEVVEEACRSLEALRAHQAARSRPFALGVLAGLVVALATGDRLSPLAWLIGVLAGAAIVRGGGRRGLHPQLVALACASFALLVGKYLSFVLSLHDLTHGGIGVRSRRGLDAFTGNLDSAFRPGDLLPLAFALWGAWALPRVKRRRPRSP